MRKTIAAVVVAIAGGLVAAGCTPPAAGGTATAGGTADTSGQTLVVYSNSVSDGRGDWLKAEAKKAGFTVSFVDLGGGDIQNRLLAEKSNPVADVTFGLNNVYFNKLEEAGVLDTYKPSWADQVDPSLGDPNGQFYPIVREPVMLVYANSVASKPPTDWPDLWTKPQFGKRYEVQTSLGGATTQIVLTGILSRYRDDSGELGISKAGWDAVKAYFADGAPSITGTDLYARMAQGKIDAGQMWLAGKVTREKQYKISTTAVHPAIGVPMTVQQVGLVKGTKKADAAKKFIDWFGSADVQAAWSKQFFTAPTNKAALATADQDAVKITDSFTPQQIDWAWVTKYLNQWIEKIELDYLGK